MTRSRHFSSLFLLVGLLAPALALAAPSGGPLIGFGQSVLDFLTGTLGPIVFGIGLAVAAISIVFGSREGLQKAIFTVIGGALLFSVGSVVSFVASIAH
jgi:type IV secretory pathway VirB2 component (pilin)